MHKCYVKDSDDTVCESCCGHGDVCTDERICLDCDKDMTENLMCAAYDRVNAMRYDE